MSETLNSGVFRREQLSEGVFFSAVTDNRYKMNKITIAFWVPLDFEKASEYALLVRLLSRKNARFPETRDFRKYEAGLYSAALNHDTAEFGDTHSLELSVTVIDDAYALNNEKITSEASKLLADCIFRPYLKNDCFAGDIESLKRAQIEEIEAEINEKREYSAIRACEIMCEGEPAAVNRIGGVEKTKIITAESLTKAYKTLLETAEIEIFCVGCNNNSFDDVKKMFRDEFSKLKRERDKIPDCISSYSILKSKTANVTEKFSVTQSKLVLGFKTDSYDHEANSIMGLLYGGTATSKLFLNVRERLSLCYYCAARLKREKGLMYVSCGVETANIEKAKSEILYQLDEIKNGNFTDAEIGNVLMSSRNSLKSVNDSLSAVTDWYLARIYQKNIKSPEEQIEQYEKVTRDDIIKSAKSMKLDTVYVLTELEEKSDEQDV